MKYKRCLGRGWFNESYRHSLAAKGIKTSFQIKPIDLGVSKRSFAIIKKAGFYYIDPDDFLEETGLPPKSLSKEYFEDLKKSISEKGVEMPAVISFKFNPETQKYGVVRHEGRHRALASKQAGRKLPVIVDVEGDSTWFEKYVKMYPEDKKFRDSTVGIFLKRGEVSGAFAYSDKAYEERLRKLFGIPDSLRELGKLH